MYGHNDRVAIVTGATSVIGFEMALALSQAGVTVLARGRNDDRIAQSRERIAARAPDSRVLWINAHSASLRQVARSARRILQMTDRIDVPVNIAGNQLDRRIMIGDGFEMT